MGLSEPTLGPNRAADHAFLAGGGEMGERIRAFDWAQTPLGPPERWPQSLRSAVSILLPSKAQIVLFWGPDLTTLYNDAYRPVFGAKHPHALGLPAREAWSEIWSFGLSDLFAGVLETGEAYWASNRPFFLKRHGFIEETFFDVSYDPVRGENGEVAGIFCIVSETTARVLGERRLRTLRDLSERVAVAKSAEAVGRVAGETLAENVEDLPFTLVYLLNERRATLAGSSGLVRPGAGSPVTIDLDDEHAVWPLARVVATGARVEVADPPANLGAWLDPLQHVVVLPLKRPGHTGPSGFVVAGISPRLRFDEDYRTFLDLLAGHVSSALANVQAYQEERRRAETLAELDRAKTAFFSNVSHEFRTPLTLMLGPVEDLIAHHDAQLPRPVTNQLYVVRRNGQRLLRLVNTLLDFSRIEAGRVQAIYRPTDLAAYTADLASLFRSACERGGLKLVVDSPPLPEPVFVDRDMWEKIVLNLLSNAFKFTHRGSITVSLRAHGDHAELQVADTGIGIAGDDLPRIFERFHRVESAQGRTHEGSGIGLALVHELVKLHAGEISLESEPGRGTTFTVRVPMGREHLAPEHIEDAERRASSSLSATPFVEEALRWLPDVEPENLEIEAVGEMPNVPWAAVREEAPARVLVVDDNADMRDYLSSLLSRSYDVETAANGQLALEHVRERVPDLVLTDVMMPRLDGFGLLAAIRADEMTRSVPVIVISARAGEESRVEGLEAGADGYLVKPFSARELLACVASQLELARVRREGEERLREADRRKDEFLAILAHELRNPLSPMRLASHYLTLQAFADPELQRSVEMIERQTAQMARLIDDLLDVSRITRGVVELRLDHLDFIDVARAVIEACGTDIELRAHTLHVDLPPGPITLRADRERLVQVFSNLILNAVKYTPAGGRIEFGARVDDRVLEVWVQDNGVGIPADKLHEIFDLFTQLDRTLESQGGLGIGLTLARQIAQLHHGTIEARSDGPGRGSRFVVRLPIVVAAPQARKPEPEPTVTPRRVLVADDNVDAAESLALLLRMFGHEVRIAIDGEEAVRVADEFRPEVAFLDIGMPKVNGHEAAMRIRERPWGRNVRLVALTGWGQPSDRLQSEGAGFDEHVVKPASPDVLRKVLRDAA
jgi:signal transduction histidine kinase